MFCCSVQPLCVCSRDDSLPSETIEQIIKGVARILVTEESLEQTDNRENEV
jgi:hypothetical protein